MKSLLVATDFSTRSDRAVRRAVLIAKPANAALTLLHVIDDDQPARLLDAEWAAAEAILTEQAQSLRDLDGIVCATAVVQGDPFQAIAAAANGFGADLTVIGPHRRQALKDVFVGTTAERIIRTGSGPVLMANGVPANFHRHALLAVDFSECSATAVRAFTELNLHKGCVLTALNVFDAPITGHMARASLTDTQIAHYILEEEGHALGAMASFLKELSVTPDTQIARLNETSPADVIARVARELSVDLIVLGTRGQTGAAKLLLGSVAEQVLRRSDIDVLAVPPRG